MLRVCLASELAVSAFTKRPLKEPLRVRTPLRFRGKRMLWVWLLCLCNGRGVPGTEEGMLR